MFSLGGGARVYLATGTTDLRRSFSLYHVIEHQLGFAQALNGDVFGFINRRRNLVKLVGVRKAACACWASGCQQAFFAGRRLAKRR
jgi:hypothetical protein